MRVSASFVVILLSLVSAIVSRGLASAQTVSTIYSFTGPTGEYPGFGVLTQGRDGRLYGTTQSGGAYGYGNIFKQRTVGPGNVVLYNFTGGSDGGDPYGGLTLAKNGYYYGTTLEGGTSGKGTLFEVTSEGIFTVLYNFTGAVDGSYPAAPPIEGTDGNFYGTTNGFNLQDSALYRYNPFTEILTTLYTFDSSSSSWSQPLQGSDGYLYATSSGGGEFDCGYIVKLTTEGAVQGTHSFDCFAGGNGPVAPLTQAADGNYYGTTEHGGLSSDAGIIFKLDEENGKFTVLHDFGATNGDGLYPAAGITQGNDGNLYGATAAGGSLGYGSLFRVSSSGVYSRIYSFPILQGAPYQAPTVAPVQDTNGTFYGTTELGGSSALGSIYALSMGLGPFVEFVHSQGNVGAQAEILGQGFIGTTSVTFNGVSAAFIVDSNTYLTATVPPGASSGSVTITTPGGPLISNKNFTVTRTALPFALDGFAPYARNCTSTPPQLSGYSFSSSPC